MANNIKRVHQLDIIVSTKLDERQMREVKKNIFSFASNCQEAIEHAVDKAQIASSLNDALDQINNQLRVYKLPPIDIGEVENLAKPFEELGRIAIERFKNGFSLSGDAIESVADTVNQIYDKINSNVGKSTNEVVKSISQIEEAAKRVKKLKDLNISINKTSGEVKFGSPTLPKKSKPEDNLNTLYSVYNEQKSTSLDESATWEQKYAADIRLVDFIQKFQKKFKKFEIPKEIMDVYGSLLDSDKIKRNMLTNVANLNSNPNFSAFVGYDREDRAEPWAREDTLREIKDILAGGIKVENSGDKIPQGRRGQSSLQPKPSKSTSFEPEPIGDIELTDTIKSYVNHLFKGITLDIDKDFGDDEDAEDAYMSDIAKKGKSLYNALASGAEKNEKQKIKSLIENLYLDGDTTGISDYLNEIPQTILRNIVKLLNNENDSIFNAESLKQKLSTIQMAGLEEESDNEDLQKAAKEIQDSILGTIAANLKKEAEILLADLMFGDKTIDEAFEYFKPHLIYSNEISLTSSQEQPNPKKETSPKNESKPVEQSTPSQLQLTGVDISELIQVLVEILESGVGNIDSKKLKEINSLLISLADGLTKFQDAIKSEELETALKGLAKKINGDVQGFNKPKQQNKEPELKSADESIEKFNEFLGQFEDFDSSSEEDINAAIELFKSLYEKIEIYDSYTDKDLITLKPNKTGVKKLISMSHNENRDDPDFVSFHSVNTPTAETKSRPKASSTTESQPVISEADISDLVQVLKQALESGVDQIDSKKLKEINGLLISVADGLIKFKDAIKSEELKNAIDEFINAFDKIKEETSRVKSPKSDKENIQIILKDMNNFLSSNKDSKIRDYFTQISTGAYQMSDDVKSAIEETIGNIESLQSVDNGANNYGGLIGDKNALILRKPSADTNSDKLIELQNRLGGINTPDVNLGQTRELIEAEEYLVDLQNRVNGDPISTIGEAIEDINIDVFKATEDSVRSLIQVMRELYNIGVEVDTENLGNILYDGKSGKFGIVDMDIHKEGETSSFTSFEEEVNSFVQTLKDQIDDIADPKKSQGWSHFVNMVEAVLGQIRGESAPSKRNDNNSQTESRPAEQSNSSQPQISDADITALTQALATAIESGAGNIDSEKLKEINRLLISLSESLIKLQNAIKPEELEEALNGLVKKISDVEIDTKNIKINGEINAGDDSLKAQIKESLLGASKYIYEFNRNNIDNANKENAISIFKDGTAGITYGDEGKTPLESHLALLLANIDKDKLLKGHSHAYNTYKGENFMSAEFGQGDLQAAKEAKADGYKAYAMFTGKLVQLIDLTDVTYDQLDDFNKQFDKELSNLMKSNPDLFVKMENGRMAASPDALTDPVKFAQVEQLYQQAQINAAKSVGINSDFFNQQYDITNSGDIEILTNRLFELSQQSQATASDVERLETILVKLGVDTKSSDIQTLLHNFQNGSATLEDILNKYASSSEADYARVENIKNSMQNAVSFPESVDTSNIKINSEINIDALKDSLENLVSIINETVNKITDALYYTDNWVKLTNVDQVFYEHDNKYVDSLTGAVYNLQEATEAFEENYKNKFINLLNNEIASEIPDSDKQVALEGIINTLNRLDAHILELLKAITNASTNLVDNIVKATNNLIRQFPKTDEFKKPLNNIVNILNALAEKNNIDTNIKEDVDLKETIKKNLLEMVRVQKEHNERIVNQESEDYTQQELIIPFFSNGKFKMNYGENGCVPNEKYFEALLSEDQASFVADFHTHPFEKTTSQNGNLVMGDNFSMVKGDTGAAELSKQLGAQIFGMLTGDIYSILDISKMTEEQIVQFNHAIEQNSKEAEKLYPHYIEYSDYNGVIAGSSSLTNIDTAHNLSSLLDSILLKSLKDIGVSPDIYQKFDVKNSEQLEELATILYECSQAAGPATDQLDKLIQIFKTSNASDMSKNATQIKNFISGQMGDITDFASSILGGDSQSWSKFLEYIKPQDFFKVDKKQFQDDMSTIGLKNIFDSITDLQFSRIKNMKFEQLDDNHFIMSLIDKLQDSIIKNYDIYNAFISYSKGEKSIYEVFNDLAQSRVYLNPENTIQTIDSSSQSNVIENNLSAIIGILSSINSSIDEIRINNAPTESQSLLNLQNISDLLFTREIGYDQKEDEKIISKLGIESIYDPKNITRSYTQEVVYLALEELGIYREIENGSIATDDQDFIGTYKKSISLLYDAFKQVKLYEKNYPNGAKFEDPDIGDTIDSMELIDELSILVSQLSLEKLDTTLIGKIVQTSLQRLGALNQKEPYTEITNFNQAFHKFDTEYINNFDGQIFDNLQEATEEFEKYYKGKFYKNGTYEIFDRSDIPTENINIVETIKTQCENIVQAIKAIPSETESGPTVVESVSGPTVTEPKLIKIAPTMDEGAVAQVVAENVAQNPAMVKINLEIGDSEDPLASKIRKYVEELQDSLFNNNTRTLESIWDEFIFPDPLLAAFNGTTGKLTGNPDMFNLDFDIEDIVQQIKNFANDNGLNNLIPKNNLNIDFTKEITNLADIKDSVLKITDAVKEKTSAFEMEEIAVDRIVKSEVNTLEPLKNILETITNLINNIKSGVDINTGLSNININVNYPEVSKQATTTIDVNALANALKNINVNGKFDTKGLATDIQLKTMHKTLGRIAKAIENVDRRFKGKLVAGINKQPSGSMDVPAWVKEQRAGLNKWYSQLLANDKLSPEFEAKFNELESALSGVFNGHGINEWLKKLRLAKNEIGELNNYQKIDAQDKKSRQKAVDALSKQYENAVIKGLTSKGTEEKQFWNDQANYYLVERATLLQDIYQSTGEIIDLTQRQLELDNKIAQIKARQNDRSESEANAEQVNEIYQRRSNIIDEIINKQKALNAASTDEGKKAAQDILDAELEKLRQINDEINQSGLTFDDSKLSAQNEKLVNGLSGINKSNYIKEQEAIGKERIAKEKATLAELIKLQKDYYDALVDIETSPNDEEAAEILKRADRIQDELNQKKQDTCVTQEMLNALAEEEIKYKEKLHEAEQKNAGKERQAQENKIVQEQKKALTEIENKYKKIGELRAKQNSEVSQGAKDADQVEIDALKQEIDLLIQKNNLQRQDAEWQAIEDKSFRTSTNKRDAAKANKDFKAQLRQSQRDAKVDRIPAVTRKAEDTFGNAADIEGLTDEQIEKLKLYNEKTSQLKELYNQIKTQEGPVTEDQANQVMAQIKGVTDLTEEISGMVNQYNQLSGDNVSKIGKNLLDSPENYESEDLYFKELEEQLTNAVQAATDGRAHITEFDAETKTLSYTINDGARKVTSWTAALRDGDQALVAIRGTTKTLPSLFDTIVSKTKQLFSYFAGSNIIYKFFNELKKGINYVREIDAAMTELKKVTNETEETYDKFMKSAAKTAATVGSTMKDVISSTADWARLGYSLKDAAQFAESTQTLMNVSEFTDVNRATDALISSVQAFKYTAESSMEVVDILNQIGEQNCL